MFRIETPFLKFWIISLFTHLILLSIFFISPFGDAEKLKLHLTEGSSISLLDRNEISQKGAGKLHESDSTSPKFEGTTDPEYEIDAFRNSLSYPELAMEQNLEDDCTFRVTVAENGLVEKLVVVAPCKYNVFDSQIRSQLRTWKFNASKGKDLTLPIRFRIHARE